MTSPKTLLKICWDLKTLIENIVKNIALFVIVKFSVMSSSIEQLTNLLATQFVDSKLNQKQKKTWIYNSSQPEFSSNWSPEKISNILKVKPREERQVEAGLYISSMLTGKRFVAIDNYTIDKLSQGKN